MDNDSPITNHKNLDLIYNTWKSLLYGVLIFMGMQIWKTIPSMFLDTTKTSVLFFPQELSVIRKLPLTLTDKKWKSWNCTLTQTEEHSVHKLKGLSDHG